MMNDAKKKKIFKCIKDSLVLDVSYQSDMHIFVLAVNKDRSKNNVQPIKFDSGTAIGSGVYDSYNDCFYVKCEDYMFLGSVPLSVTCYVKDNQNWSHKVPFSINVLNKLITKNEKNILKDFMKSYPKEEYEIEFLQLYNSKCK